MYEVHEMDLWRQRRDDLLREAENERLVRRLRAARRRETSSLGDAPLRLALAGSAGEPGARPNG